MNDTLIVILAVPAMFVWFYIVFTIGERIGGRGSCPTRWSELGVPCPHCRRGRKAHG